jgi:ribosomal protein S18 acetylase RimI-like enzyme
VTVSGPIVRRAEPPDYPAVAYIRARSWQVAYAALMPAELLASLTDPETLRIRAEAMGTGTMAETWVALVDGDVIGFVAIGDERTDTPPDPLHGEVYALYVLPEHWGDGAGHALMNTATSQLAARGFGIVSLWVLEGNPRAIAFYERQGFAHTGERILSRFDGLPEVRFIRGLNPALT